MCIVLPKACLAGTNVSYHIIIISQTKRFANGDPEFMIFYVCLVCVDAEKSRTEHSRVRMYICRDIFDVNTEQVDM